MSTASVNEYRGTSPLTVGYATRPFCGMGRIVYVNASRKRRQNRIQKKGNKMGEVRVPQCDIFKTLQPKGLKHIHVEVTDTEKDDATTDSGKDELIVYDLAVSQRGRARVVRMIEQACRPPKTREPKADAEQGE